VGSGQMGSFIGYNEEAVKISVIFAGQARVIEF
jgi:hypothetical protein